MTTEDRIEIRGTIKKQFWGLLIALIGAAFTIGVMLTEIQSSLIYQSETLKTYQGTTEKRLTRIEDHLFFRQGK